MKRHSTAGAHTNQIGTGALKEIQGWGNVRKPEKIMALWRNASAREWIVRWLNAYCDYSMTIDIPIWTKTMPKAKGNATVNGPRNARC
jgi:hypothetical protein